LKGNHFYITITRGCFIIIVISDFVSVVLNTCIYSHLVVIKVFDVN